MGKPENLKESNKSSLAIYAAMHGLLVAWLAINHPTTLKEITPLLTGFQFFKPIAPFFVVFVVPVLNRLPPDKFKAMLVFWRIRNPLPGCRAFSDFATADPHIDPERVRKALGTYFPRDPVKQNQAWRHLYNQVRDSPSIQDAHKDYLLFRDAAWLTLPIGVACFAYLGYFNSLRAGWRYLAIVTASYLIVRFTAKRAGETLVKQVLSVAADAQELQQGQLAL